MIYKILLTGAPLSGKTTIIKELKKLNIYGYKFISIPEVASLLMESGYDHKDYEWQVHLSKIYVEKEKIYNNIAQKLTKEFHNVVILYDRYVTDGIVYLDNLEWHNLINEVYINQPNIRLSENPTSEIIKQFDNVFVLDSLAALGKNFYNEFKGNNEHRTETYEAALLQMEYYNKYFKHFPNAYLLPAYCSIEERMHKILNFIKTKKQH